MVSSESSRILWLMADETKPTPDPTILTTEQLLREIERSKELMTAEMTGVKEVTSEKFDSVKEKFALVERQRVEQKADAEKGIQAALSAAKEAVAEQTASSEKSITKSETATKETIGQMQTTFTTAIEGTNDKVLGLSSRLDRIESAKQGAVDQRTDTRSQITIGQGLIASLIALITVVVIFFHVGSAAKTPAAPVVVTVTTPAP
jgi:cobalamin biosynthesis Mg chelatase CobN